MKFMMDAWHGDASVWKKFGSILLMWKKKLHLDLPYRPTRTTIFKHGVLPAMHEMTPNFTNMWACSWQASMQNVKELGHRTHVASRPGSVLGFFRRENPRKCIGRRKIPKIVRHACHGAWSTWKKFGFIRLTWKKNVFQISPNDTPERCWLH